MILEDLLGTPNPDLTDEELELKINVLRKLKVYQSAEIETETTDEINGDGEPVIRKIKIMRGGSRVGKTIKSNKDRRITNMLAEMSDQDRADFMKLLSERKING